MSIAFINTIKEQQLSVDNLHTNETLRRISQLDDRITVSIAAWKENNQSCQIDSFNFPTVEHKEIKSLKLKKTILQIAIVAVFVFLCVLGVAAIGLSVSSFFIPAIAIKEIVYYSALSAGGGTAIFALLSEFLWSLNFFAKKRVMTNEKFEFFANKFIISQDYQTSLKHLMGSSIQKLYYDWKDEMTKIEQYYNKV